jgi:hypothetical protein
MPYIMHHHYYVQKRVNNLPGQTLDHNLQDDFPVEPSSGFEPGEDVRMEFAT